MAEGQTLQEPQKTVNTQQAVPQKGPGIGERLGKFSKKILLPITLGAAVGAGGASAIENNNTPANPDTGYTPNQPGMVEQGAIPAPIGPTIEVTTPNTLQSQESAQAYSQNPWADQVRAELEGKTPLTQEHKIVDGLKVVTYDEPGTDNLVNLRDGYPSDVVAPGIFQPEVKTVPILGKVGSGTEFIKAIEVKGRYGGNVEPWFATEIKDIKGQILGQDGQPLQNLNPEQIVAISGHYVEPVNPPIAANPAPQNPNP